MSHGRPLAILGTRAFAEEVAALVEDSGAFELTHFVENLDRGRCGASLLGREVLWVDDLPRLRETHEVVCAIGATSRGAFTGAAEAAGMRFATIIHPSARVLPSSRIGEGSILSMGVLVGSHTTVGRHAILNRGVTLGHHSRIGDLVTICPGTNVAGRVELGDRVYVGMGTNILNDLRVGSDAVVGAGSVVTRDVPDRTFVVGYPAMVARRGENGRPGGTE